MTISFNAGVVTRKKETIFRRNDFSAQFGSKVHNVEWVYVFCPGRARTVLAANGRGVREVCP
jgi:hypothetical protein